MTMIKKESILELNLQLFAEGGDGGASGNATADGGFATSETGVKGGSQNVDGVSATETQEIDREAEFKKLIEGEYKDLYGAKVKETVEKRVKGLSDKVKSHEKLNPALDLLRNRYGIEDITDVEALAKAIEDDDSYYEAEAMERGMTVEELKRIHKIERENAEFRRAEQDRLEQERREEVFRRWDKQTEETKAIFPGFDFDTEFDNNPDFRGLLAANVDVKTAYQVCHQDEIMSGAMQYAAKTAEKRVADNIAANGKRPTENGVSSQSASVTKVDISKMSNAQMDEYIRKARNGEKVTFR